MTGPTDALLETKQSTHGEYAEHARATQHTMRLWEAERNWPTLSNMQKETLHMIAHKVGRILTGNPDVEDHWDDIAGYARLISQRIATPVTPFNGNELYAIIARGMDISRDDAHKRFDSATLIDVFVEKNPDLVLNAMVRHGHVTKTAPTPPPVQTYQEPIGEIPLDSVTGRDGAFLTETEIAEAIANTDGAHPSEMAEKLMKKKT